MSGLLKKDLLLLKAGWKSYALMVMVYAVCGFAANPGFFSAMMSVMLLVLPLNAFSADEQSKWDGYAAALPGGRRAMVRSRYQLVLLVAAAVFVLSLVMNGIIAWKEGLPYGELVFAALVTVAVGLLADCIICPLMFKYGVAKGRVVMLIGVGAVVGLVIIVSTMSFGGSVWRAFTGGGQALLIVLLLAVMIAAPIVSYRCSLKICEKKEY